MKQYAYVRVSSKDQNIDRQLAAIEPYAVPQSRIFCDKQSGKDFERPAWQRLLRRLRPGDLLIVLSIDRLGRNYDEILDQWRFITRQIGADILVLDMPLLDTRAKEGDLTGAFISDLVLQILAYVAQTEREFIHRRQAEGIAVAKAKGIHMGRFRNDLPEGFEEVCQRCQRGELTIRKGAIALGMTSASFHRRYQEYVQKQQ